MTPQIITVAAAKGGWERPPWPTRWPPVGGVLVDLDWDAGGATGMWGFDPLKQRARRCSTPSSAAPEGRAPRLKRRANQPALVPAHPDLSASRIDSDLVADCLSAWAEHWQEPYVVVDTHPGANPLTDGAMQVADLVVVPVVLGAREMDALEAILADYAGYRLSWFPRWCRRSRRGDSWSVRLHGGRPPGRRAGFRAPLIRRRRRRAALVTQPNPGVRVRAAAAEFRAVAESVEVACG